MKPAWDQLAKTFHESPTVLIADIDCTLDDSKAACESNGVRGYPTIMYFNESNGKDGEKYQGQRDLKSLTKFVKKVLKGKERKCGVELVEGKVVPKSVCFPEEVAYLEKWGVETMENIEKESSRITKKLKDVLKADVRTQLTFESKMLSVLQKAQGKTSGGGEL